MLVQRPAAWFISWLWSLSVFTSGSGRQYNCLQEISPFGTGRKPCWLVLCPTPIPLVLGTWLYQDSGVSWRGCPWALASHPVLKHAPNLEILWGQSSAAAPETSFLSVLESNCPAVSSLGYFQGRQHQVSGACLGSSQLGHTDAVVHIYPESQRPGYTR